MPRYYFDVWEADGLRLDDEGIELRDVDAVQNAAVRSLADMAREALNSRAPSGMIWRSKFAMQTGPSFRSS
jgi:hypothetical protein